MALWSSVLNSLSWKVLIFGDMTSEKEKNVETKRYLYKFILLLINAL